MRKVNLALLAVVVIEIILLYLDQTAGMTVKRQKIHDPALARITGGARVAQISDLHLGKPGLRERRLAEAIERLDPDILFITGDFLETKESIIPCAQYMRRLAAGRLVIAVPGNNDHLDRKICVHTQQLIEQLKAAGVQPLVNESMKLTFGKGKERRALYVVGLDDNFLWFDDIDTALNNVPQAAPKVLLAHSANIVEKIETSGIRLVLSGHTHGGQVVIPFVGVIYTNPPFRARKRFVAGLYDYEDTKVYVNRGIGTVSIPLRFLCKPEITLFEFTA